MIGSVILGFILGLVLGSFTKVLADRSLAEQSFKGRSYCPNCHKTLRWYDLFPILSYLSTAGKCRYCQHHIPVSYPLVELLVGLLVATAAYLTIGSFGLVEWTTLLSGQIHGSLILGLLHFIFSCLVIVVLVSTLLTDIVAGLIPDRISLKAIQLTFIYHLISAGVQVVLLYFSLQNSPIGKYLLPPYSDFFTRHALMTLNPLWSGLLGAILIGGFFGGLIWLTRGRGMGGGDLKLGIFIGLALGLQNAIVAIMLAFLTGSIVGIGLLLSRHKNFGQTIPFGPFLSLGALIGLFWGNQIFDWYMALNIGLF